MLSIYKGNKSNVLNHAELNHHSELVNNYHELSDSDDEVDWASLENVEKLTEDNLVTAAVSYSNGLLPLVSRALCLTDPNLNALNHIPFLYRSILHPLLAFKILYYRLIRYLGQQPFLRNFPVAKSDLQLIFLLFVYCFVSSDNSLFVIPLLLYYVSFVVLTITTCQMLQVEREFLNFRVWSRLFITYSGGSLNPQQAEYQYIRNNLKPYGHFFLALLINLIIYPIILELWLPQSEITIFAFCLTFMTLFGFMPKRHMKIVPDYLVLLSFAINVLAKYPYETDNVVMQGWRFLDLKTPTYLPTFASYIIGNGIEFCVNFRVLLYAFIPFLFVRIASRDNWRGTYKYLIPHCVTLSWLQIVIINSQGATMYGLLRSTLALVGFVLFLPLAGLTTVLIPAAALAKWLISTNLMYGLCTFLIFSAVGLSASWFLAKSRFRTALAFLQIFVAALALYFLLASSSDQSLSHNLYMDKEMPKTISWEQYEQFCYEYSKIHKTTANVQMNCMKLEGVHVQWEGYVNEVKIKAIKNKWKYFFDYFPNTLREYFYCLKGDEVTPDCKTEGIHSEFCLSFYNILKSNNRCSLDKYNLYELILSVKMQYRMWDKGIKIVLEASDPFKNFTFALKQDDHIWFKGTLRNNKERGADGFLGGPLIHVKLDEIGCISCANNKLTEFNIDFKKQSLDLTKLASDIYMSVKFVLNFLLNPLFVFK